MTETERIVRIFHESWDLRDPDRGAAVIAEDCQFEDVARDELQPGPEAYRHDYYRWREALPDGECKLVNVIVQDDWARETVHMGDTARGASWFTGLPGWLCGLTSHKGFDRPWNVARRSNGISGFRKRGQYLGRHSHFSGA